MLRDTKDYLTHLPANAGIVKLDFRNAFNSIRRDTILDSVNRHIPELYAYVHAAYGSASNLFFGETKIVSAEGVQQGDPLGPLLFSLAMHPVLQDSRADLVLGYLDDVTLGGKLEDLSEEVGRIQTQAAEMGLTLNESKSEVICGKETIPGALASFKYVTPDLATLLGSPLSSASALDSVLTARLESLKTAASRLELLHSHDALVILKHSLSLPSLLHLLRTTWCGDHPTLYFSPPLASLFCPLNFIVSLLCPFYLPFPFPRFL